MKHFRYLRIFFVLSALAVCTSYLHATTPVLTASTTTINLTCTQGQACSNSQNVTLTDTVAATSAPFAITGVAVPWITLTQPANPVVNGVPGTLTVAVSSAWTTLNVGLNTTTFMLASADANGGAGFTFTVNLLIQNATPALTIKGGMNTLNPVLYLTGSAAPTLSLTLLSSSGLPVPFTVATSSTATPEGVTGWLNAAAGSASGIVYSFGSTISFTTGTAATTAIAGDVLSGTITITPNGNASNNLVVPVLINVNAGAPTISASGVTPSLVPLLSAGVAPGYVSFLVKGTGFLSAPAAQKTKVFYGATAATCTNLILTDYVTVLNSTYLQIQVPYSSSGAPFNTSGAATFYIGVANGANPTTPSATASVGVTSAPIISGITSASTFIDAAPGTNPSVAPYDIISIFGTNLCPLCTGTSSVLVGAPDTTYFRFPTFSSPDGSHKITVIFSKPGTPATNLPGYLLFATNNQINVAVPGALSTLQGTGANAGLVNVQVAYDTATPPAAANTSTAFVIAYAAVDPGIFTIESSGQGQGAILDNSTGVLNSQTHYADTSAGASTVQIYLTGLGVPDSTGTNSTILSSPGSWALATSNCIAPTGGSVGSAGNVPAGPGSYMATVNTPLTWNPISSVESAYVVPNPLWSSIDGAVLYTSFLNTDVTVPCFLGTDVAANNLLTVTIGTGTPTTLTAANGGILYAGFVPNSIAGLYQIDAALPQGTGTGSVVSYPVSVTVGSSPGVSSQAGVTMWIK
jgi:uncharacterized protein (TIGR03437 family)